MRPVNLLFENRRDLARLGGFEPPTSGSGDQRQNAMLMILLAQSCMLLRGFVQYSALNGPKSDPAFWGEPLRWHNFFGHSFRFRKGVLASPSRRRGLGKGTAFESLSPAAL